MLWSQVFKVLITTSKKSGICFELHTHSSIELFFSLDPFKTYLPVEVGEFEVEESTGEAAEAQVRAEACWAGEK